MGSPEFLGLLTRYRKQAFFCMHRNMQQFSNAFSIRHPNLKILQWDDVDITELIHKSSMVISDYSSICMDFAYMRRPVLYYQFDYEEYRIGHLPTGYFDYEMDGFGPICRNVADVVREFENILKNNSYCFPKYLEREKNFFSLYDDKNCERTYLAIKEVCNNETESIFCPH